MSSRDIISAFNGQNQSNECTKYKIAHFADYNGMIRLAKLKSGGAYRPL
jgi:hypothetical protein